MTVAHLLASISSRELSEWMALRALENEEAKKADGKGSRWQQL